MGSTLEIERKFLLHTPPEGLEDAPRSSIRQGYLAVSDTTEVRLRDTGESCFLTVKSLENLCRTEHEVELTREQLETLWPATAQRRVEKTRHVLTLHGVTIEVDIYHGALAGLMIAEVEFDSLAAARGFVPPEWFASELTDDPRFKNRELALIGRPPAG